MENSVKQTKTYRSAIVKVNNWIKEYSTVQVVFENWYVGVTNDPEARSRAHKSKNAEEPFYWLCLNARSAKIALAVESYFHGKGMREKSQKGGVTENSKYVYVYKKHMTLIDYIS